MTSTKTARPRAAALLGLAGLILAAGPATLQAGGDDTKPPPREISADGVITPGPALTPDQVRGPDHPRYPRGWTCSECHDVSFGVDFVSTASRQYLNNFGAMPNDQIWEKIVKFLPGRERFVMATVHDNKPTATTVDMVLDQEEKVLYIISEKGTEKLLQIRENPNVSAVRNEGWSVAAGGARQWISTQINGQVELIDSTDKRFIPILQKYNLVRISMERAVRRFVIQRFTPSEIVYFDTTLEPQGFSIYQYWKRDGDQKPAN